MQLAAFQPHDALESFQQTTRQQAGSAGQPQVLRLDLSEGGMGSVADTLVTHADRLVLLVPIVEQRAGTAMGVSADG